MKTNSVKQRVLLVFMMLSMSACSSFSMSSKSGTVTVETKPKQPDIIVNQKLNVQQKTSKT